MAGPAGEHRPDRLAVVDVLALAVFELPDHALPVQPPHLPGCRHVAVVFAVCVDQPALLDRLDKLDGLLHGLNRQHLTVDVPAGFQAADRERRVTGRVVGQHHRVHILPQELFKRVAAENILMPQFFPERTQDPLVPVADRGQFRLPAFTAETDHTASPKGSQYPNADFSNGQYGQRLYRFVPCVSVSL